MLRYFLGLIGRTALVLSCICLCAVAARSDIKLDAAAGIDNNYRPESWTPVSVHLTGTGTTAAGTLQVVISSRDGTSTYSKPLHLHAGPVNETHVIYYLHEQSYSGPPATVVAQLLVDGRKVAEKKLEKVFNLTETQPAIAALTQDRSGLSFLTKIDLGRIHYRPGSQTQYNQFGNTQPVNPTVSPGNNPV